MADGSPLTGLEVSVSVPNTTTRPWSTSSEPAMEGSPGGYGPTRDGVGALRGDVERGTGLQRRGVGDAQVALAVEVVDVLALGLHRVELVHARHLHVGAQGGLVGDAGRGGLRRRSGSPISNGPLSEAEIAWPTPRNCIPYSNPPKPRLPTWAAPTLRRSPISASQLGKVDTELTSFTLVGSIGWGPSDAMRCSTLCAERSAESCEPERRWAMSSPPSTSTTASDAPAEHAQTIGAAAQHRGLDGRRRDRTGASAEPVARRSEHRVVVGRSGSRDDRSWLMRLHSVYDCMAGADRSAVRARCRSDFTAGTVRCIVSAISSTPRSAA